MERSRNLVTAEEKQYVINAVSEYPELESKEMTGGSILRKRAIWEKITKQFNAVPSHNKKTTAQVKKMWENIKTKRKQDFCAERNRLAAASELQTITTEDGTAIDALITNVDCELKDAINGSSLVTLHAVPFEEEQLIQPQETLKRKKRRKPFLAKSDTMVKELEASIERDKKRAVLDTELHELKKSELQTRVEIAEIDKEKAQLELDHSKKKHEMEIEFLKKKYAFLLSDLTKDNITE